MTTLGISILLDLVEKVKLIENLSERELKNPEGTGFDLRIGKLSILKEGEEGGFLGITERSTPPLDLIAEYDEKRDKQSIAIIQPGEYYVMTTIEKVNTPDYLVGFFRPRTTLFRSGLTLYTGVCSPRILWRT